jgi:hypothetical protein
VHEINAMTEGDALPSGQKAVISSVIDDSTVMVKQ